MPNHDKKSLTIKPKAKTYTMLGMKKIVFFLFVSSFFIYFITSAGKTPYDYFTRLADSFLNGKYYLAENPSWLSELIPAGANKFYVVYPPMPAALAVPFRFLFEGRFEQQYLAHMLGAGITTLTFLLSWSVKKNRRLAVWAAITVGFGSIVWFLSSSGSSWYLGQASSAFFLTAALFESLNKKRPFLVGLLLGASFLSRLHTILSLPLFLYLLRRKDRFKNYSMLGLGILPFIAFNFYYNFIRFGTIFDKGYLLIPGILSEPWYQNGLFSLSYIPNHLKIIFASFPKFLKEFPYIVPSWAGLSIWITTPAFIYSFLADTKEWVVRWSWLVIILIALVVFSHGTAGFTQFGYRFAVDFYPILMFLTIKGTAKTGLKWHHWTLLSIGIIVNLWGVLWINKFGWVSF